MGTGIGRFVRKVPVRTVLRILHPAAYHDQDAIEALKILQPLINRRTIAVVGNAASVFKCEYGNEIDNHDVIVRMNRGYVLSPRHQGSRTDILCVACRLSRAQVAQHNPQHIIFTGHRRDFMKVSMAISRRKLFFAPRQVWEDLRVRLDQKGPSTGLIVLEMISRYFDPARITLYGFDWMETKTFYKDEILTQWHEWDREKELVEQWLAEAPDKRFLRRPPAAGQLSQTPESCGPSVVRR